jgi:long-chain acyl-CoA synthetase
VVAAYQQVVNGVNEKLARFETIKRFRLIPGPFTIDSGELTPTLKVKRRVIEERYREIIDALYADHAGAPPAQA